MCRLYELQKKSHNYLRLIHDAGLDHSPPDLRNAPLMLKNAVCLFQALQSSVDVSAHALNRELCI